MTNNEALERMDYMIRFPNHLICLLDIKSLSILRVSKPFTFQLVTITEGGSFELYEDTLERIEVSLGQIETLLKAVRSANKRGVSVTPIIAEFNKARIPT